MSLNTVTLLLFSVIIKKMLEKNEKKLIFDAHFHYFECKKLGICEFPDGWSGISCAHSKEEWEVQKNAPSSVLKAYGIHPQSCGFINIDDNILFLENLIKSNEIIAIGEAGFDYFTDEFIQYKDLQEKAWNAQLEMAIKNQMTLIVHCRKANEKLFEYSNQLKKVPEVLFHSFMGSSVEGKSLLSRGINGYFSFGKQIFNGNKKVLDCVRNLPPERVLAETDAPFQFLKGEKYTRPDEIVRIINGIKDLQRGQP